MVPRVIVHVATSIDGRIDSFSPDLGLFYGLIATWKEDATLAGAETILRAMQNEPVDTDTPGDVAMADANDTRPLLVIPDSRGRIRTWDALRRVGHWRDCVALVARTTPGEYLEHLRRQRVQSIAHGEDHVDLRAALEELGERFGVRTVRVDSGGILNGVLLRAGLVDEVSLLVHPVLVGGTSPGSMFRAPDLVSGEAAIDARLKSVEQRPGSVVWLRYDLRR